jgi:hypothetical protein
MAAFNIETQEEELLLVGVEFDEEGKANCFPVAKCLASEDVNKYLSPDGAGGYFDPRNPAEAAAAKENMRSYEEAVEAEDNA